MIDRAAFIARSAMVVTLTCPLSAVAPIRRTLAKAEPVRAVLMCGDSDVAICAVKGSESGIETHHLAASMVTVDGLDLLFPSGARHPIQKFMPLRLAVGDKVTFQLGMPLPSSAAHRNLNG